MKINVPHVAKLANLTIPDSEVKKFEKQLEETLEYIQGLNEIKTENVEPTSQVTGLENITREDTLDSTRTFSQDEALSNTKSQQNGFFKVKGVFGEE